MKSVELKGDLLVADVSAIAEVLGVSERQVLELAKKEVVVRLERGVYELGRSVQQYFAYKQKAPQNQYSINDEELDKRKDEADTRRAEAKAAQEEVKTDLLLRKVHRSEDVERIWNDVLGSLKSKVLAMPAKAVALAFGCETEEDMERALKRLAVEMLADLQEYDSKELNPDPIPEDLEGAYPASLDSDE